MSHQAFKLMSTYYYQIRYYYYPLNIYGEVMKFQKNTLLTLVMSAILMTTASAACLSDLKAGKDYKKIEVAQGKTLKLTEAEQTANKTQVIEFFWYGCPHCHQMEPLVDKIVAQNKDSVLLKRYPVMFPRWESGARLFFTIQDMGLEDKLHKKIFHTIQVERINIMDVKESRDTFLKKEGVDVAKFDSVYNSFSVDSKMKVGKNMVENYKLTSSPTFVVNNTYQVEPGSAGGYEGTAKSLETIIKSLDKSSTCK